jgi:four helix bundle protein
MGKEPDRNLYSCADELESRLIDFAVRIIRLSARLPRTAAGKHIAGQILRSGTSPAPNYGEARGAESRADFVHKLRVVLKELNETSIWLRIIERSQLLTPRNCAGYSPRRSKQLAHPPNDKREMSNDECQMIASTQMKMITVCVSIATGGGKYSAEPVTALR